MKKIARLMTLALVVFALASCEDVPSPFGTVTPPKGDSRGSDIPPTGTGTATDPFNVQKAIDFVKELGADVESETALYVKGKVLSISEISASYGNASFILSDDTEGTNKFTAYRVKGFNTEYRLYLLCQWKNRRRSCANRRIWNKRCAIDRCQGFGSH